MAEEGEGVGEGRAVRLSVSQPRAVRTGVARLNEVATHHTRSRLVLGMPVRKVETGLWPAAVKEVICPKSYATPQGIATNGPAHQIVQWRGRMGIGTHFDTDGAV